MNIEDKSVKFQVDSGATCNVIPKKYVPVTNEIESTTQVLTMFNRTKLIAMGKTVVKMTNPKNNKRYMVHCVGIDDDSIVPILGSAAAQQMKLVVVQYDKIMAVESTDGPLTMWKNNVEPQRCIHRGR